MLDDNTSNPAKIAEQIGRKRYNTFVEDYIMQVLLCMTTYRKQFAFDLSEKVLLFHLNQSRNQLALSQANNYMEGQTLPANQGKATSKGFLLTKTIFIQSLFPNMDCQGNTKQSQICQLACMQYLNPHWNHQMLTSNQLMWLHFLI